VIVLLLLRLLWWWGWCDAGDGLMLDGAVQDGLVGVMIATKTHVLLVCAAASLTDGVCCSLID
jgi:hypothetical protein